jgi:predicted permease
MTPTPRLARALLALACEPDDRPWMLADLDEEFAALAARDLPSARRWYWQQAVTSFLPLVRRRLRRRRPSATPARSAMLNGFRTELHHALRFAARTKAPTAAIVLTMALGIGATAAVSTVVWKVVLQPIPVRQPECVLAVYRVIVGTGHVIPSVSYPDLQDWRRRTKGLSGLAPYTGSDGTLITGDGPVPINAVMVGEDFFEVFGSRFALGRPFGRDEFADNAPNVVILSGTTWQREFGGDPGIIGRTIELATGRATVVGVVAPGEFTLPLGNADLWMPLHAESTGPNAWQMSRGTQWLEAVARVRPDVDPAAAMAELRAVDAAVQQEFPRPSNAVTVLGVAPLGDYITGPVRTTLLFLAGAVIVVLLVVCTNIANLRLAQAQARQGEFAMRVVLGAGFTRLRRQVLTESMLLALAGALVGVLLARPLLRGLLALYPGRLPRASEIHLDPGLAVWSMGVAVAAGVLFAIPQLVQVVRMDAGRLVKDGERGTSTRRERMLRRGLVVVQLALSVVMLISGGALVRTFIKVSRVSSGFDSRGVLSFGISAPATRYPTLEASEQLYRNLADRLLAVPGVRSVATTNAVPFMFNPWRNGVRKPNGDPNAPDMPVNIRLVSPGCLELLRVPLVRGRWIATTDDESAPGVVLINEALAETLYPGEDPIGRILPMSGPNGKTIVGITGNIHHTSLTAPADNEVYAPFRQMGVRRSRVVAVRVDGDPTQFTDEVRRVIRAVDPQLPVRSMRSLDEVMSEAVAPQRFRAAFIGSLAALALVLAVVGVYGVMSYAVSERTRELGIRVALGESPGRIRRRVHLEGLQLAALGSALGAAGTWAVARVLRSLVFEVGPGDPWTLGAVAAVLMAVTVLAADGPARRAGRVDPLTAIRGR